MRRVTAVVLLVALTTLPIGSSASIATDRVWFCPGPGTSDFIRLFERPQEWSRARRLVSVFKFYQQHTQTPAPSIVGPNSYDALVRAGVFQRLSTWGTRIALEVGAVKEFYCTPGPSGMNAAIADSVASIRAVERAGGAVSYLALDEPFLAGRSSACGGPSLEATANRLQAYGAAIRQASPGTAVGLIEAYPSFNPDDFAAMLELLSIRGVRPAFLHVDVDIMALRPGRDDFVRDISRLQAIARQRAVPFGFIIWGYNGDADPLYGLDADRQAGALANTFRWSEMPEHLVFQSWAVSSTGLLNTPSNLPEEREYSHTQLLWSVYRRLLGQTAATSGTAVIRR
jgi:hypothetical protein